MDDLFEQWSQAFQIMIEVLLSADGQFDCLRQSSNSSVAVVFMYFYVLITCVMLVNMLIALMAKTFVRCGTRTVAIGFTSVESNGLDPCTTGQRVRAASHSIPLHQGCHHVCVVEL